MENSQHPGEIEFVRSGDVRYGEMLLKSIYEVSQQGETIPYFLKGGKS
jgi:hypothetical protein